MAKTITFTEVITFVTNDSTAADLTRFNTIADKRRKQLSATREASITAGQSVRLGCLRDFTLNGLRGTVASIDRRSRCSIALDAENTLRYRSEHYLAADVVEHTLTGIPLGSVYPI